MPEDYSNYPQCHEAAAKRGKKTDQNFCKT